MLKVECPLRDLTMNMIQAKPSHWPVFKVKAAEARYMVPICYHMACNWFPLTSDYEKLRLNMLEQLVRCYDLLIFFAADAMGFHGRAFNMLYNQLNRQALAADANSVRWRLYPKFHLMIHICESGENPKDARNYMDESAIGDGANAAERCPPNNMHRSLIQNYRIFDFSKASSSSKHP